MQSRGFVGAVIVVALIGSALVAPSATAGDSSRARTLEKPYYVTRVMGAGPLSMLECGEASPRGCVEVMPKAGERFVNATIVDDAGMAVYGYVNQDVDGDGMGDLGGPFCGKTDFPFRIRPKIPVRIFILTQYDYCPGAVATKGTVVITVGSSVAAVRRATES